MESLFGLTFLSVFQGLVKIFLVALLAGILSYRKFISKELIDGISKLVVWIFLPLLIFDTITAGFDPDEQSYWWIIPFAAIFLASVGLLFSSLLFARNLKEKKAYLPVSSMQNAAYLILPIGEFVYKERFEEFSLICFLVVMGLSPFMWTVGKLLITNDNKNGNGFLKIFTPPFIANIVSISLVLSGLQRFIPGFVSDSAAFLGKATVPLATFILGATLAASIKSIPVFFDSFRIIVVKFILLPLTAIFILRFFNTGEQFPLLADVLVIQSSSAPATAHILQIRTYGGNLKSTGGIIFLSYFVALIAIPFWLTIWKVFF